MIHIESENRSGNKRTIKKLLVATLKIKPRGRTLTWGEVGGGRTLPSTSTFKPQRFLEFFFWTLCVFWSAVCVSMFWNQVSREAPRFYPPNSPSWA